MQLSSKKINEKKINSSSLNNQSNLMHLIKKSSYKKILIQL